MTTPNALTAQVADAFNRHGSFAARIVENELAVEVRYVDTGAVAATVWLPETSSTGNDGWIWLAGWPGGGFRYLPKTTPTDVLVPAVATHVLDEGPKR